jgi:hypothetical protein
MKAQILYQDIEAVACAVQVLVKLFISGKFPEASFALFDVSQDGVQGSGGLFQRGDGFADISGS